MERWHLNVPEQRVRKSGDVERSWLAVAVCVTRQQLSFLSLSQCSHPLLVQENLSLSVPPPVYDDGRSLQSQWLEVKLLKG